MIDFTWLTPQDLAIDLDEHHWFNGAVHLFIGFGAVKLLGGALKLFKKHQDVICEREHFLILLNWG